MVRTVIILLRHRYLKDTARTEKGHSPFERIAPTSRPGDLKMRKTILTILGSAALAASFVQVAAASERHHVRKAERAPVTQTYRNTNAWVDPYAQPNWGYAQSNWSRYEGGAISAPAGH